MPRQVTRQLGPSLALIPISSVEELGLDTGP